MKLSKNKNIFKKFKLNCFLFITACFLFSCNNNATITRVNPTPPPNTAIENSNKPKIPVLSASDNINIDPIKVQKINLGEYTFDLEIKFDGILGRAIVNDGPLLDTPVKMQVKGGSNKIEVFDLITGCRIAKYYIIDKNTVLDLTGPRGCRNPSGK
ncbi:MAG: hypothetical protein U0457_09925 [Candidatus Sericytochromatia bacterium]